VVGAIAGGPRILVVDDDELVREAILSALRHAGYTVAGLADATRVAPFASEFRPDLLILDIGLQGDLDGLRLARRIRETTAVPLMFVTATAAIDARLQAFDLGADDYLTKPFVLAELLARVRAVLRRTGGMSAQTAPVDDLVIDEESHTAMYRSAPLALTRLEFSLLTELSRRPGRVMSKQSLLDAVWDYDGFDPNVVEVHISALRRKLEAHGPRLIQTVRGVGYVLRPPAA
jgi:DNA-binding response OmpR family regulator